MENTKKLMKLTNTKKYKNTKLSPYPKDSGKIIYYNTPSKHIKFRKILLHNCHEKVDGHDVFATHVYYVPIKYSINDTNNYYIPWNDPYYNIRADVRYYCKHYNVNIPQPPINKRDVSTEDIKPLTNNRLVYKILQLISFKILNGSKKLISKSLNL